MSALAPTLQAFFTERLARQRAASPHTVAAYRDAFRLLLAFAAERTGVEPSRLDLGELDAPLVAAFLDHLEHERGNRVRTRNARLAAIHSLYRFAARRHPEHADLIARVLDIPPKRCERALVTFLTAAELQALLAAPERSRWSGRRDHALLLVAAQTGLRASELLGLRIDDVHLGTGAHVACHGKGRKQRITPLTGEAVRCLRVWLKERGGVGADPLFPARAGRPLGRDGLERLLQKHAARAARACPSLAAKRISPHVLRHTAAMQLLAAGVDSSVIALWLGHERVETTQIYLHADLAIKERALARIAPASARPGRYRAPDRLLAFLEAL